VIGYLHYDSEGVEPELHRIYVDPGQKRGGVGSALMRELHARLPPSGQYILLVAELNKDAQAFYERHGLVIESRVDGPSHYINTMAIETDEPPPQAAAILMRYTASSSTFDGRAGRGRAILPPSEQRELNALTVPGSRSADRRSDSTPAPSAGPEPTAA
jgi:Acetyltransferase (GNAT) domain